MSLMLKMNTSKKRVRASNFDKSEIKLLIDLATEYRDIIDNKRTDAITNSNKTEAWRTITRRFNETRGTPSRSVKMLKAKYDNIKKTIHMIMPPGANGNETEESRLSTILSNLRDSDSIATVSESSSDTDENNLIIDEETSQNMPDNLEPEIKIEAAEEQNANENKWQSKWVQYNNSTPKNSIATKTAGVTKRRNQRLSTERLKLMELQRQLLLKEMEHKQLEHDARMQQIVNEEKRRQELHDLNMKMLYNKNNGLE